MTETHIKYFIDFAYGKIKQYGTHVASLFQSYIWGKKLCYTSRSAYIQPGFFIHIFQQGNKVCTNSIT